MTAQDALDRLAARDGTVLSVWAGAADGTGWLTRLPNAVHLAASTLKLPLVVAAHRLAVAGRLDLDEPVRVTARFASAADGAPYDVTPDYDNDEEPWQHLGRSVPLRWLTERAIVRSSNLATNLVLERVGTDAVNDVYDRVGATTSRLRRGIQDTRADDVGIANTATASDLAAVVRGLLTGRLLTAPAAAEVERLLAASEWNDAVPAGLPPGTYVAHKSGWTEDCCHDVALVRPVDEPPFVVSIFTTTRLPEDAAHRVVAEAAAVVWRNRPGRRRLDP